MIEQYKGTVERSMEKGDLIRREADGAFGIVISDNGADAEVLFGDGLREIVDARELAQVRFKLGATIPASFPELVDAYIKCRGFE